MTDSPSLSIDRYRTLQSGTYDAVGGGGVHFIRWALPTMGKLMKLAYLIPLTLPLLAGCAGVGIVYSSDPYQKLENATVLYQQQDRPLAAKRLILEVIADCEEKNDRLCLATAWATNGFLYQSESAKKWASIQGDKAFPADRYIKSTEYFEKAATTFYELKLYDKATNAYFGQGIAFEQAEQKGKACASYAKSLDAYKKNVAQNPNAKPIVPRGYSSYEDFYSAERKRVGCE